MTSEDRDRLVDIRKRLKRGRAVTEMERLFVRQMWLVHREAYREVDREIQKWGASLGPLELS